MVTVTLYHNPRCSKSRQTLALLEEQECNISVVEYLKTPPTAEDISNILAKLGLSPRELMRTKETEYKALALDNPELSDADLIQAIVTTPKLLERPVALANDKAAIGRPPENVLAIL